MSVANKQYCQIGTTGKGLPCMASIYTLAGLTEACEVCGPHMDEIRKLMGWIPFRGKYWMSNKLADFQQDALLGRIGAVAPASQEYNGGDKPRANEN